jgi:hypothetical protein
MMRINHRFPPYFWALLLVVFLAAASGGVVWALQLFDSVVR